MKIDIWSDVVCPFCYVGKRHLEKALEAFPHADDVDITWHSFELDPTIERVVDGNLAEAVGRKYGMSPEQAVASQERIAASAAAVGLEFNWREARFGNTFDAHRLIHLAAAQGLADAAEERFKRAYFTEGKAIGDQAVLRELAIEIGLAEADVDEVLSSDAFAAEVREDEEIARQIGIRGVPFFVFDEKFAVSGAQPIEVFSSALQQAWDEAHPKRPAFVNVGEAGETCGPDGC